MKAVTQKIGFIGAGVMAQAVGKALLDAGLIDPALFYVSAPSDNNLGWWKKAGANTTNDNNVIVDECPVVILAMKPQYFEEALRSIDGGKIRKNATVFISILAGFSTSQVKDILQRHLTFTQESLEEMQIFHVVPNTAITVGAGCTAYCYSVSPKLAKSRVSDSLKLVETIFSAGGVCVQVPENILNAVSAVSGSGVAYVYVMIEALCDGAVKMGVPRGLASQLAVQTFLGAAKMVQDTGKHPGLLKDEVCSAGGTTIAAIHAMEKAGVRGGLIDAVEAAVKRSGELAKRDN